MKHQWRLWLYPGSQYQPIMPDERRAIAELCCQHSELLLKANLWDWQANLTDGRLLLASHYQPQGESLELLKSVAENQITTALNRLATAVLSWSLQKNGEEDLIHPASSPSTS